MLTFRIDSTRSDAITNGDEFADVESLDAALREIQRSKKTGAYSKTYVSVFVEDGRGGRASIYRARLDLPGVGLGGKARVSWMRYLRDVRAYYRKHESRTTPSCAAYADDKLAEVETVLDHIFASRGCAAPADDFTGARVW